MLLWTIQHRDAYENMLRSVSLRADESRLFCGDEFKFAYDWLAARMREKIGEPPEGVKYPVWAWYQWEGVRKRPDMRGSHKCYGDKGTPIVLLTADVPDELVLLSDFDMWHCVLTNSYIAVDEADDENFCGNQLDIEQSWLRMFDIAGDYAGWYSQDEKSIQAAMWEIKAEWVRNAEFFVSR